MDYDLLVIGGGPGGYVAAIRGSQRGMKVAVVERELLGGVCLNWGCIPSKALLKTAEMVHLMNRADEFGIRIKEVAVDFDRVVDRSRQVAGKLNKGIQFLLKKNK